MAPITFRSFMAVRPPTRVGVVTIDRCRTVSTSVACRTLTTSGFRMSARTYSARSRSTSGSSKSTPTTYSTSGSFSRRWASFPPRNREMPVIRTRCPTSSPYPTDHHRVADADTQGFRELPAVHRGSEPSRGVHDQGGLSGADVGERSGPPERDRPGLVGVEHQFVPLAEPGGREVGLAGGELNVAEAVDREDGAPYLAVDDLRPRHRDGCEAAHVDLGTERAE